MLSGLLDDWMSLSRVPPPPLVMAVSKADLLAPDIISDLSRSADDAYVRWVVETALGAQDVAHAADRWVEQHVPVFWRLVAPQPASGSAYAGSSVGVLELFRTAIHLALSPSYR